MSESRESRQWTKGDPEPDVGTTIATAAGFKTTRYELCWYPGQWNWQGLLERGPLTEVLPEPAPETSMPEKPIAASLREDPWQADELPEENYLGGPAVCTAMLASHRCELGVGHDGDHRRYVGPRTPWELWNDAGQLTHPVPPVSSVRGASISPSPVSSDAEGVSSQVSSGGEPAFRAATLAVLEALNPVGPDDVAPTRSTEFAAHVADQVEQALIAEGWRPPATAEEIRDDYDVGVQLTEIHDQALTDLYRKYGAGHGNREQGVNAALNLIANGGWRPPLPEGETAGCPCGRFGTCDHNLSLPEGGIESSNRPLNTALGAITRWTVNVGPKTAEALNYVTQTRGVTNTEALRVLAEAGYAVLRQGRTQLPADWREQIQVATGNEPGQQSLHSARLTELVESWLPLSPLPADETEHERALTEEVERRDEAEEWADKLAAALAPPHVVGGHSLKNHPWRNALEWAQQQAPADETEWEWGWRAVGVEDVHIADNEAHARTAFRNLRNLRPTEVMKRRPGGEWEVTQ